MNLILLYIVAAEAQLLFGLKPYVRQVDYFQVVR